MNDIEIPVDAQRFAAEGTETLAAHLRLVRAEDLFGTAREIGIVHDGALYRLRMTRAGKLILTK